MATRIYLPSSGNPPANLLPAFEAGWTQTSGADRILCSVGRGKTALTDRTNAGVNGTTLLRQYISDELMAQTIAVGTVKGTLRCFESAVNDNILQVTLSIRVVSNDGATYRSPNIIAKGERGPSNEWTASPTLTNRRIADGDATSEVVASARDRLVIELGYFVTSGTSISGSQNFGDDQAADCADDESGTGAANPFVELSGNLLFVSQVMAAVRVSELTGVIPQRMIEVVSYGSGPQSRVQS